MGAGNDGLSNGAAADGTAVFRGTDYSPLRTTAALALWLGAIHFNVLLVLASLLLLPRRVAALVLGTQLFFMLVPVNDKSRPGRKIARFISKYVVGYFPVTLHVEDYNAFDPKRAYVFGYEPHSVLPIGLGTLLDLVGFMPTKDQGSCKQCGVLHPILEANMDVVGFGSCVKEEFLLLPWSWLYLYHSARRCTGDASYGSRFRGCIS